MRNITVKSAGFCFLITYLLMSCAPARSSNRSLIMTDGVEEAVKQADTSLMTGDYKTALKLYAEIYAVRTNKTTFERFSHACKQVQTAADQAFQTQNFARAGSLYYMLLRSAISDKKFKNLSLDPDYLMEQISACSRSLTEIGLAKYREEKLDEAISIWKNILAFDPENRTVTKAIQTASRQLQQLKRIN